MAEQTSEPPPADQARQAPPLVRPDRQLTYDGAPHYEWPDATPLHDHDTITVDRIREDIDGPSHRFVIKRGDRVEAWFGTNNLQEGTVVGISHANQEVRVRFCEGTDGQWFYKGQIYPAIEPKPERPKNGQPLSKIIAAVNDKHGNGLTEADRVPSPAATVTPAAILAFLATTPVGVFTTGDLRHEFACPKYDPAKPLLNPVHQALERTEGFRKSPRRRATLRRAPVFGPGPTGHRRGANACSLPAVALRP